VIPLASKADIRDDGIWPVNSENGAQEFDPFAHEPAKKEPRSSGGLVAWLAIFLALAAAGLSAYQWWLERVAGAEADNRQVVAVQELQQGQARLEQDLGQLESRFATVEQQNPGGEIAALKAELASLRGRVAEIGLESADGSVGIEAVEASLLGLQQRIAALETSVAALAVRGDSPGKRMDLSEVEYLLRLASERLQLFGDPVSADRSLALADERLAALEDPLYLPVRQRIAGARQALSEVPVPDTVLLSERISSLQRAIPALPFPGERPVAAPEPAAGEDQGLWARFKRTMSGLVTVRRRTGEDSVLLSLEDKDYLRQGLWLQLESARLAVMRADAATWTSSLQRAADTLLAMFDEQAPQVEQARAEIDALQQTPIVGERPDISAPWAQLRLLREGRSETDTAPAGTLQEDAGERPASGTQSEEPAEPGEGPGTEAETDPGDGGA
jgi:uroporphyrin-3 C-methyltransferase